MSHNIRHPALKSHLREERHEVEMVIDGPEHRYAIEIKSGDFTARNLIGLLTFCERHRDFQPLVIGEKAFRSLACSKYVTD